MVTVNIEIRYANSMRGCPDYIPTTKEEALIDSIQDALEGVYERYPKLRYLPYVITPSKVWQNLSNQAYWFREQPTQKLASLCFIRKKRVGLPESELVPIYLTFPLAKDVPKISADLFEDDAFLDS